MVGNCWIFFDPKSQPEEYQEMEEKILHDPTQLINIFQGMLCNAESIAELCMVCYNLHTHLVSSELKRLMLFATWPTLRWTQVASNQWVWARGTFRIARDEGQSLIINVNGYPFQLQKAQLANELQDSSGDIHGLQFLHCNFADNSVGKLAFAARQGNRFPYLHKEEHFRAAVTVSKEGMVVMKTGSVESVGYHFGDLEHHLRRYRNKLRVHENFTRKLKFMSHMFQ